LNHINVKPSRQIIKIMTQKLAEHHLHTLRVVLPLRRMVTD
jgi:hypothetical protein